MIYNNSNLTKHNTNHKKYLCAHCQNEYDEDCVYPVYVWIKNTTTNKEVEQIWCENCVDKDAFCCDRCVDYHAIDSFQRIEVCIKPYNKGLKKQTWCHHCVKKYSLCCDICATIFDKNNVNVLDEDGCTKNICEICSKK